MLKRVLLYSTWVNSAYRALLGSKCSVVSVVLGPRGKLSFRHGYLIMVDFPTAVIRLSLLNCCNWHDIRRCNQVKSCF